MSRRRRRVLLILAVAAAVIGVTLGLFGSVLRDDDDKTNDPRADGAGPSPTGAPVPSLTSEPTVTGPAQPQVPNADLTFDFLDLRADGLTLSLRWNDPSDGEGEFVLTQTAPERTVLRQFAPGVTEGEISYPLAEGDRACFVLSVHMPDGRFGMAKPQPRCVTAR